MKNRMPDRAFEFHVMEAASTEQAAAACGQMVRSGSSAVGGGISAAFCHAISAAIPDHFVEVRSRHDVAPDEHALRLLAVTPSYAQLAGALAAGLRMEGVESFASAGAPSVLLDAARTAGLRRREVNNVDVVLGENAPDDARVFTAGVCIPPGANRAVPMGWAPCFVRAVPHN